VLIEALQAFKGTLVVASHDEEFIKQIAGDSYTLGDGQVIENRTPLNGNGSAGANAAKKK